ncbi:hypothetical protein CHARACLAT_024746 [Characodon lateralis]|uniref:PB1 domain-containing protein n=1 Tax=Characodon lateralis TaxID=208331 RepID=A0ABU7D3V6_9TELE|nr:hypothetical protein [Characodon lateralis]
MAASVKLRIILGENNSQRLILQNGLPATVPELVEHIKKQCAVQFDFRLQFMDADFGNEFTNLTSISEIEDKSTIKLIFDSGLSSDTPPPPYSAPSTSRSGDDSSLSSGSVDTDILSSPDSVASRSSGWPVVFVVPRFPYDCELQLEKASAACKATGTLLDPDIRLKTAILDS